MSKKKRRIMAAGLVVGLIVSLSVYFGLLADRGTPPFDAKAVYSLSVAQGENVDARYATAADFNGDGRKEVLVSYDVYFYEQQMTEGGVHITINSKEGKLEIFSRNATGDFQELWEYDSGLTRQTAATGDFNGDGRPDIVVGGFKVENVDAFPPSDTSLVEVLLQEGDGAFYKAFSSEIPAFFGPGSIVAGDFDGDDRIDFVLGGLAVGSESTWHAYLFHNGGAGDFAMSPIALRKGIIVQDMWKADINDDGSLDLVIQATDLGSQINSIILLSNDGRGEFGFQELAVPADSMIIEDFAGDGYPDILYTESEQSGDKVYFLPNDKGESAEPEPVAVPSEGRITGMVYAEFDNDNTLALLLLESRVEFSEEEAQINLIEHLFLIKKSAEGGLSFTPKWSHGLLVGEDISSGHGLIATDINNDGRSDLILISGGGQVYLALNRHN